MCLQGWFERREEARERGRERCRDLRPEQRAAALRNVVRAASFAPGDEALFARGWLDEWERLRTAAPLAAGEPGLR